jgi:SAM-dependent methyltransferase
VSTASVHGPRWGARAADWAELAARVSRPAWEAVADATGIGPGRRVLDLGCGSGEFCALVLARGADASGVDAAEGMIAVARRRAPGADLRVGGMERIPWADDRFDVATAFNALQFAADSAGALAEARRVVRPGGLVAVCGWGRPGESELGAVIAALRALRSPPPPGPAPPPLGEPGVLEDLMRRAALAVAATGEVDAPYDAPDRPTLERALLASGGAVAAIEHSGEAAARAAVLHAAAPFRRPDGSYRFENRFRYLVAEA